MKLTRLPRGFQLACGDGTALDIDFDRGGRFRVVATDVAAVDALIERFDNEADVAVLPADGGMVGAMSVAQNYTLALGWGRASDRAALAEHEPALEEALRLCGLAPERLATLGREQPMRLPRVERWLVGFVRHLLRPPELLVLDRVFNGLSRREAETVAALQALYHDYHPFRPALFVDVDSHELPRLAHCRGELIVDETPCPC